MTTSSAAASTKPLTPALLGSLALGAGLTVPMVANATLVVTNINQTVAVGGNLIIDFNGDANTDFRVGDFTGNFAGFGVVEAGVLDSKGLGGEVTFSLSPSTTYLTGSSAGDTVDASDFVTAFQNGYAFIGPSGFWSSVGAHGFAGLRMDVGGGHYHYGWLELTRGSLIVGRMGYETALDTAAPIPAASVPEPSTLLLLASGAAALAARRRRELH